MPATASSPNTGNYFIGKGNVYFTQTYPTAKPRRHMGNVPEFVFTPELETLEHFSSMGGVKLKDFEIILEKKGTLKLTLEEITPANAAIAVLGDVDEDAVGGPEVDIFSVSEIRGMVELEGSNDYGAKINATYYNVQFTPTADLSLITDELGSIEVEGSVQPSTTSGPTYGKFGLLKFINVVPDIASDLDTINPTTGPAAGGTAVTLTGTGFSGATGVTFGGTAATSVVVLNDTTITCVAPAHVAGVVAVVVADPEGNGTLAASYTYA